MTYPNRLQRLILKRMAEISQANQRVLTDEDAARMCLISGSTFSDIVREDKGEGRQIVTPENLHKISDGLRIPLEPLLDAGAFVAGYRRQAYDESDLLSVVRFWLTDDLRERNVRESMRAARDALQRRLDEWAEEPCAH